MCCFFVCMYVCMYVCWGLLGEREMLTMEIVLVFVETIGGKRIARACLIGKGGGDGVSGWV